MSGKLKPWWTPARLVETARLYRECLEPPDDILAAINAVDPHAPPVPTWRIVKTRMGAAKVKRHTGARLPPPAPDPLRQDDHVVAEIARLALAGARTEEIAAKVGRSSGTVRRIMRMFKLKRPPRPAPEPRPIGRPLGAKTKNPRPHPQAIVLHAERRPRPFIQAQTVDEWIRAGGVVKRCPTVALLPTQARIPAEELAAIREHHAAQDVTWREQIKRHWAGKGKRA